jgi:hypothetical protein
MRIELNLLDDSQFLVLQAPYLGVTIAFRASADAEIVKQDQNILNRRIPTGQGILIIPSETFHAKVIFVFVFPEPVVQFAADIVSVLIVKSMQNKILKVYFFELRVLSTVDKARLRDGIIVSPFIRFRTDDLRVLTGKDKTETNMDEYFVHGGPTERDVWTTNPLVAN